MTELPRTSHAAQSHQGLDKRTAMDVASAIAAGRDRRRASASYVARHWRGELSLARAFWLDGVVAGFAFIAAAFAAVVVPYLIGFDTTEWAPLPGLVVSLIAAPVFASWQAVGIWRSANRRTQKDGLNAWSILAKVATILGLVLFAHDFMFRMVPSTLKHGRLALGVGDLDPHKIALSSDGSVMTFSGRISNAAVADVGRLLDENGRVRAIFLDSRGGEMLAAMRLHDLIRGRALDTYVDKRCASACAIAFMGGKVRGVAAGAVFGFDQTRLTARYSYEAAVLNRIARDDMVDWGIAPDIARKAFGPQSDGAWNPSVNELLAAHVATRIISTDDIQKRLGGAND